MPIKTSLTFLKISNVILNFSEVHQIIRKWTFGEIEIARENGYEIQWLYRARERRDRVCCVMSYFEKNSNCLSRQPRHFLTLLTNKTSSIYLGSYSNISSIQMLMYTYVAGNLRIFVNRIKISFRSMSYAS